MPAEFFFIFRTTTLICRDSFLGGFVFNVIYLFSVSSDSAPKLTEQDKERLEKNKEKKDRKKVSHDMHRLHEISM